MDEKLLDEVKVFLKIDEDDEDQTVLPVMMEAAKSVITDAVGSFEAGNPKHRLLFYVVMQDFHENRVLVVKEADRQRLSHVMNTIILQLQTDELIREGDASG